MLILGLKEGNRFKVGDTMFEVVQVRDSRRCLIEKQGHLNERIEIGMNAVEVMPNVRMQTTPHRREDRFVRIGIDAPKTIPINRQTPKYLQKQASELATDH